MGVETNPNWIIGRIAEELSDRNLIREDEFDAIIK